MISIITRIQVEGNDTVSFLNGAAPPYQYVQGMSQIMPQVPTYISYGYDSISITQDGSKTFQFTVYTVTDVGGNTFTALTFQDPAATVQAKTIEIYRLLVTSVFKGCCECGNTEPECSIQYTSGNGVDAGTLLANSGSARINYFTANNQDFTGFWPIIQDGSWIFIFSKTDPTVFGVFQLSNYSDGGTYAQFDISLLSGTDAFPEGTTLCVDVTSVGGSLVQGWQDTLDINSTLDKNNTVDGGGFDFIFNNNDSFTINSVGGSIQTSISGSSLIAGGLSVDVASTYVDVITPGYAAAGTGWVLAKDSSGHVEYVEAGTGTISSIGLNMPPAFTVSTPNPLTSNGEFTVDGAGTDLEYIDGTGNLQTFPIYTVRNGLHTQETPADPHVFHLGGQLIEGTIIDTNEILSPTTNNEWQFSIRANRTTLNNGQDTQFPLGVANLGNGGVATFQDYGEGNRPNPSVEVVGDIDLFQPLLELRMEGDLPNPNPVLTDRTGLLRLKYDGDPSLARMSIDYQFKNDDANPSLIYFIGGRLTTEVTNFTANAEESNFELQLFSAGSRGNKLVMEGKGQLELTNYATNIFWNGDTNIDNSLTYVLAVDGTGKVWKKQATGGGTVFSIDVNGGTGISVSPAGPITTSGTFTVTNEAPDQIVILNAGDNITITGTYPEFTINADGGTGFDVQVNTTTIIPPATVLNLKSGADIDVIHEGGGTVRFDWTGTTTAQGLQDVIIVDNVLTQDNTVQGSITSLLWKSNSFYEINPVTNYDPGTGTVPGYFKAYVGKYPPSYSELYVEAIYAQMKSKGATDQVVKVDTTGVYVQTPALGSASNGYVLTLVDQTSGKAEWQLGGSGETYTVNNGLEPQTTPTSDPNNFQLGGPLVRNTIVTGSSNAYDLTFDEMSDFTVNSKAKITLFAEDPADPNKTSTVYSSLSSAYIEHTDSSGNGQVISQPGEVLMSFDDGSSLNTFVSVTGSSASMNYSDAAVSFPGHQVIVDAVGVKTVTPDVKAGSATVGQVLTLINATTGEVEFQDGGGGIPFGIATGTDVYAVTAGTATTYTDGDAYLVRFTNGNTGGSTLNVNGIGARNMYSNSDGLLIGGDIWAESQMLCVYDSLLPGFKCIGTSTNSLFAYVTNAEATTITKGTAVYAAGGTGDRMTVKKALATGDSTSALTVGMVFADIAANQKGIILIQGELVGLNLFPTSGGGENWNDGEPVYLSATTAGAVTRVKQYAPNHLVYLGICVKASNGSAGRMYVRIQNGYELDELHNVQAQSPAFKDTLWYDDTVTPKQWKTASIPTILGATTVGSGLITIPNPSAVSYIRIKADNTVDTRTPAQVLSDLGVAGTIILNRDFANTYPTTVASTNNLLFSVLIPANTLVTNDWITTRVLAKASGSATSFTIYINTTPTIPGTTALAQWNAAASGSGLFERNFAVGATGVSGNIKYFNASMTGVSLYTSLNANYVTTTVNTTVDQYLVFAANPGATGTANAYGNLITILR